MSSNDDHSTSKSPKKALLDELESIKGLLDDHLDDDLDIDIPILDDVVSDHPVSDSGEASDLLDLESIFGDEVQDKASSDGDLNFDNLDTHIDIPTFKLETTPPPSVPTSEAEPPLLEAESIENEQWLDDDPLEKLASNELERKEEQDDLFPHLPPPPLIAEDNNKGQEDIDIDIDLLIQEIVDEFIPQVEDQLRQRLSKCSPQIIQQLAKKHLDY